MTATTTHLIGSVDTLAGALSDRVARAVGPRVNRASASECLEGELNARFAPAGIEYKPGEGFYLTLPSNLSERAVDAALASGETSVLIELDDLLNDGGLAQMMG